MTAALDELKWKRGADVWYTARDDEDDPPLKKNDGCRRVAPGAVVLMLTTVVGVCITDTRRPERVASWYNVCARQEQFGVLVTLLPWFTLRRRCRLEDVMKILRRRGDEDDTAMLRRR